MRIAVQQIEQLGRRLLLETIHGLNLDAVGPACYKGWLTPKLGRKSNCRERIVASVSEQRSQRGRSSDGFSAKARTHQVDNRH
jgi:hypothetical protein